MGWVDGLKQNDELQYRVLTRLRSMRIGYPSGQTNCEHVRRPIATYELAAYDWPVRYDVI